MYRTPKKISPSDVLFIDNLFIKAISFFEKIERNEPTDAIKYAMEFIYKRYREPHRNYHNITHVNDMLHILKNSENKYNLSKKEFYTLVLAIFYHDIVYIPGGKYNEDESFNICEFQIKNLFSIDDCDKLLENIRFLIECTKIKNIGMKHDNILGALISYMDIAPLANDNYQSFFWRQYDIIFEANDYYIGYYEGYFMKMSIEFFKSLLNKERIFPQYFGMDFSEQEKIARKNMMDFIEVSTRREKQHE